MSLTSADLWQRIEASQLASNAQCRTWSTEVAAQLSATESTDAQALIVALVRMGKLTQFQADTILSGSDEPLVRNGHRIEQPVSFNLPGPYDVRAVWNNWWVAITPGSSRPLWRRWLSAGDFELAGIRDARPSLQIAQAHSQIVHENLQNVAKPERVGNELQLGNASLNGKLLSAYCQGDMQLALAVRMLVECSAGLAALHAAGLVHGRLTPDRICLSDTGRWILIRDPLCSNTFDLRNQQRGLLSNKLPGKLLQAHFMAPEFLAPAQQTTAQTDIYSLGCSAWLAITGSPPVHHKSPELILAAQAEQAVDYQRLPSIPEPIKRCIMHCLAKNPKARFANGQQLHESLVEAQRIVSGGSRTKLSLDAPIVETVTSSVAIPVANPGARPVANSIGKPVSVAPQSVAPVTPVVSIPKSQSTVRNSVRKVSKKRKNSSWLTPIIGGGALVALLLMLLVMNGGSLFWRSSNSVGSKSNDAGKALINGGGNGKSPGPEIPPDPRLELFDLIEGNERVLWAPPRAPEPIPLDLLPPGGQMFSWLRPKQLFGQPQNKQILSLLDADIGWFWQWVGEETGLPADGLDEVVIAAYPGKSGVPQHVLRVHLDPPRTLAQLKTNWKTSAETKAGEHVMLVAGPRAFYIAAQPMIDSQSVTDFVVGPTELVREAAEMQGSAGPLTSQLEHLWQSTDRASDLGCFLSPNFLFTEGRQQLARIPTRLAEQTQKWLSRDMRGAMIMSSLGDQWYYELRLIGASDRDAGTIVQRASDSIQALPQSIESWFVSQSPHPYWKAMAIRYPNMLRALASQTRLGVESGQAIFNGYLPSSSAPSLLVSSWIALQPSATAIANESVAANPQETPLTAQQILDRVITVVVDQQGIEVVLQLIGEQANEKLPSGTTPLRFELDGSGFQRSGITRNQQIRGFKVESRSVREALTELAKRGNPVVGVTDLRTAEQKLIWIILSDTGKPGSAIVSLTSREAAKINKHPLPVEFAPPN